ncbi:putative carbonic anhydrase [Helianthus anomalus]
MHDLMLQLQWEGDAGSILINDTEYLLKQAHWHSPSEHTINGRRYDMELHMVHLSIDNKIAVIAVLYSIGKPNHFLSKTFFILCNTLYSFIRLWGMGRGLGTNAQVTTPGGIGFRRGPLGGSFSPDVGHA